MSYRTTPATERRKAARRARLLAAALRLFARSGYHRTTVPRIVRGARSSVGAFYLYFRSKEDILACLLDEFGARLAATIQDAVGRASDPVESMRAAVTAFVRLLTDHPNHSRVLIVESSGAGANIDTLRRQLIETHVRAVEQAIAAVSRGTVMDHEIAARCWVGAVLESVIGWLRTPPAERVDPEALAKSIATFNLRGLGVSVERVEVGRSGS